MKKLLIGVVAVSLAGVLSTQGYKCTVVNKAPNPIHVRLELYGYVNWGPAGCSCCDTHMDIPPNGNDSRDTSGCQLRRITVTEKVPGDMSKLPKDTPQAIRGFLRGATNDVETSVPVENIRPMTGWLATGNTKWEYSSQGKLNPVSGVTRWDGGACDPNYAGCSNINAAGYNANKN